MPQPELDQSLNTGDAMLDREHETIFELLAQAKDFCLKDDPDEEVMRCLTGMYLYAKDHFFDEEGLMERLDYPGRAEHAALHRQFIEKTHALTDACLAGEMCVEALVDFLGTWMREHVSSEDCKILQHARQLAERR
jgi:hemerythrin